jgi:hypothetical protein
VTNRTFVWTLITLFFFTGIALGGYDLSGSTGAENLTATDPTVQSLETDTGSALADALAPQVPAAQPGTQLALYVSQNPIKTDLEGLMPFNVEVGPSTNVFYKGTYMGWNGFTSQFPSTSAGLWIERSAGWSWYATMPLGGWSRELLYVPVASPISMYDIYPSGFVMRYNLGVVQPGYYNLWYYADTPGRHVDLFGTSSGYSNKVIVDVYTISVTKPIPPKPVPPDPKEECEKRGFPWTWEDGQCKMKIAPNPVDECEKKPGCFWADGQCQCPPGPVPNPVDECEKQSGCVWADGKCQCQDGPAPNPVAECEKQSGCFWADGQCQCPPGPVPNPTPEPVPEPQCPPGCQLVDGQCQCPPGPVPNPTPEPVPPNPDDGQGDDA